MPALARGFQSNKPASRKTQGHFSSSKCSLRLPPPLWPQPKRITDESVATGHGWSQEAKHLLSPSSSLRTSVDAPRSHSATSRPPISYVLRCSAFHRDQILPARLEELVGGEQRAGGLILKRSHAADKSLNRSELHIQERLFSKKRLWRKSDREIIPVTSTKRLGCFSLFD